MARQENGRSEYLTWRKARPGHWAAVRKAVFLETDRRCQQCGIPAVQVHVHHLSYAAATSENPADPATLWHLTVLCPACHVSHHPDGKWWAARVRASRLRLTAAPAEPQGGGDGADTDRPGRGRVRGA
jgi:5-methylcytosine-specific restriction endonuclease McrA